MEAAIAKIDAESAPHCPTAAVRELERTIIALIEKRARMEPAITPIPLRGDVVRMVGNPTWELAPDETGTSTQFRIFYPGLGWLCYLLTKKEIGRLAATARYANEQIVEPAVIN